MASGAAPRSELLDFAGRASRWWLDELGALVPNAWKTRAAGRPAALDCVLLPDGRVACAPARLDGGLPDLGDATGDDEAIAARLATLAASAARRTVHLSVPVSFCLVRRTRLPARALAQAGEILRHEIETLTPLEPEAILADWYVETEDMGARELHVVQVVLARPRIASLEAAFAAAGLALTRLTVGDAEERPMPVDLVGRREPSLRASLAALPRPAKLLHAGALALLLWTPFLAAGREADALEAMQAARAERPKPGSAALSAGAVADFLDAEAARVPLAALLDEIARRLPSGASLAQLHYSGDRLVLALAGPEAAAARTALAASPFFAMETASGDGDGMLTLRVLPRRASDAEEVRP